MKILVISGHGDGDPGACANGLKEANLTIEMVEGIKPLLEPYATVDLYPVERNAYKDIKLNNVKVDFANYDYVLEFHFNAFNKNAYGSEIYVTTLEKTTGVETKIVKNLSRLGFENRGVKVCNYLVIYTVKKKGVSSALLETCFIDNENDIKLYNSKKQEVFNAIANGIIEGFGLKKTNTPKPAQPSKPQVDYFKKYNGNSNSLVDALKAVGASSTYKYREKIAKANGVRNYEGAASQNLTLLELLKQGKLKKV